MQMCCCFCTRSNETHFFPVQREDFKAIQLYHPAHVLDNDLTSISNLTMPEAPTDLSLKQQTLLDIAKCTDYNGQQHEWDGMVGFPPKYKEISGSQKQIKSSGEGGLSLGRSPTQNWEGSRFTPGTKSTSQVKLTKDLLKEIAAYQRAYDGEIEAKNIPATTNDTATKTRQCSFCKGVGHNFNNYIDRLSHGQGLRKFQISFLVFVPFIICPGCVKTLTNFILRITKLIFQSPPPKSWLLETTILYITMEEMPQSKWKWEKR